MGRLDGKRTRFQFECSFEDVSKSSKGKILAVLVVNNRNESYFESLTVNLIEPKQETIRVVETELTMDELMYVKQRKVPTKLPSREGQASS